MELKSSNLTPRLASSRQWTALPAELLKNILGIFNSQFKAEAQRGEFLIDGRIYSDELVMRVGYLEKGRLKQVNFESSMDLKAHSEAELELKNLDENESSETSEDSATMARVFTSIDALGSLLEEYFDLGDEEEIDVPERWRAYDFEGDVVYLQHSTINSRLEDEADRWLGLDEKKLYHEAQESEDALLNADVDSELAFEIQKAIRSGKFPLAPLGNDQSSEPETEN